MIEHAECVSALNQFEFIAALNRGFELAYNPEDIRTRDAQLFTDSASGASSLSPEPRHTIALRVFNLRLQSAAGFARVSDDKVEPGT
jgi:hypothetical protein